QTQGWTLADVVSDDGVSGGKRARLDRLSAAVAATGALRVVAYHADRFARDVAAQLATIRAWTRRGIELHVVGRGRLEATSSSGFITTAIEGVVAEHLRLVTSEKTRDALARLKAAGRRYTRLVPYGMRATADGRLEPEPAEHAVLDQL